MTACGKTERQPAEPEPPQAETAMPETAPPETAAPEPVSDTVPAAPVGNGNTQDQAETAPPETAVSEPVPEPDETDAFTEVSETVYATGTVNLRSGPGTNYDKVGSLSGGQSVTRTGIGTGTADGWSRVQTADGSTVYVSSNYLSTSKPVQQAQTGKPSETAASPSTAASNNEDENRRLAEEAGMGLAGLDAFAPGDARGGPYSENGTVTVNPVGK